MNYSKVIKHIVNWLNSYTNDSHTKGYVVGISGGIDFFIQSNPSFFKNFSYCVLNKDINQKNCIIINQKKILVSKNK